MHNLVKTFLTSITYDSLSRKIKNPCLVINKNFLKEDFTMKSKQIIIMLLSFIILFSISCKNNDKTGSGDDYSVPKATGDPATDLTDGNYTGTLNRTAQVGSPTEDQPTINGFYLNIASNKAESGQLGALVNAQVLKSGSEYSAYGESNEEGLSVKEYIKFTVSGNNITITYIVAASANGQNYKLTYEGTLSKSAS